MKGLFIAMAVAGGVGLVSPARAQEVVTGTVERTGSRIRITDAEGTRVVNAFTTMMQEASVPRPVNLTNYRGRRVAIVCQVVGTSDAWGCEAIGRLVATTSLPPRRSR